MDQPNPTASSGDASTLDRIEAFLSAGESDDQTSNQDTTSNTPDNEPDDTPAETPDKPAGGAPDESQQPQITTAQLAAFLDIDESLIDVDGDGKPVFKNKIDGKEGAAKFADYVKSYQLQGHAENRVREATAKETAAQARLQEAEQAIQARHQAADQALQQVQALTSVAQEELMREFKAVPWDDLRQQNPGEFAARHAEFQARSQRIQGVFADINNRRQQAQHAAQEQHAKAMSTAMQAEAKRLTEVIPEWKDEAVAAKERAEIRDWAIKGGFSEADVSNITRADVVRMMRNAWKHDTLQQSRPSIENLVRNAPKLVKPGQAPQQRPGQENAPVLKDLKQRARSSGTDGRKAVADWLELKGLA